MVRNTTQHYYMAFECFRHESYVGVQDGPSSAIHGGSPSLRCLEWGARCTLRRCSLHWIQKRLLGRMGQWHTVTQESDSDRAHCTPKNIQLKVVKHNGTSWGMMECAIVNCAKTWKQSALAATRACRTNATLETWQGQQQGVRKKMEQTKDKASDDVARAFGMSQRHTRTRIRWISKFVQMCVCVCRTYEYQRTTKKKCSHWLLPQIEPSQWDLQASCPRADFPHWRKHFNHLQSVLAHVSTFHQNHRIQSTPVRMAVQTPLPESTLNGRGGCIKVLARKMLEDDASAMA